MNCNVVTLRSRLRCQHNIHSSTYRNYTQGMITRDEHRKYWIMTRNSPHFFFLFAPSTSWLERVSFASLIGYIFALTQAVIFFYRFSVHTLVSWSVNAGVDHRSRDLLAWITIATLTFAWQLSLSCSRSLSFSLSPSLISLSLTREMSPPKRGATSRKPHWIIID